MVRRTAVTDWRLVSDAQGRDEGVRLNGEREPARPGSLRPRAGYFAVASGAAGAAASGGASGDPGDPTNSRLPFARTKFRPTALFVASFAAYASIVTSVPIGMEFLVMPWRISEFGLPPSIIHSTTWPSGPFTSRWNQECGLIISHLTMMPFSVRGFFTSNSDENA